MILNARYALYPLSLATLDSSPKGTPLGCAGNFAATAEAVPLGKVASPQAMTEGVIPQRRAFEESGAASAVFLHDPFP